MRSHMTSFLIDIYIKIYYISMYMSLKFSYIPYKINKIIFFIYLPKSIVNKQDVLFWFMSLR